MNKRIVILVGILSLIVVLLVVYSQKSPIAPQPKGAPETSVRDPLFPSPETGSQPDYTAITPRALPTSLTALTYKKPTDITSLASSFLLALHFSGKPTEFTGSRGTSYTWSNNNETFSLGADPIEISYTSSNSPTGVIALSAQELDKKARAFLTTLGLPNQPLSLSTEEPLYFAPLGSTQRVLPGPSGATVIQLNYRYTFNSVPLFSRLPDIPGISVRMNADGSVLSFTGYWYPGITKTNNVLPVLTIDNALLRLKQKEGVIVYENSDADANTEEIQSYRINSVQVLDQQSGYYYTPGSDLLAPVCVFRGIATDTQNGKPVKITTVVSCLGDTKTAPAGNK